MNLKNLWVNTRSRSNGTPPQVGREPDQLVEQTVTPAPTLKVVAWARNQNPTSTQMEFKMTIRTKVSNLTTKQAAMLLKVLAVLSIRDGIDITGYLAMEFLSNFLLKNGSISATEIKNEKDRQSVLLANLILLNIRGEWLTFEERIRLPEEVIQIIASTTWLPTRRTFFSWLPHWQLEKYLEFRIVPLEFLLERDGFSEPYSAYCKGYGDGGNRYPIQKTRYSAELDGEVFDDLPPWINLQEVSDYQRILLAIESAKAFRIQNSE